MGSFQLDLGKLINGFGFAVSQTILLPEPTTEHSVFVCCYCCVQGTTSYFRHYFFSTQEEIWTLLLLLQIKFFKKVRYVTELTVFVSTSFRLSSVLSRLNEKI